MKGLTARCKLWLNRGSRQGVFGDGKYRLLKAIDEKGSLTAACRHLGISYRKAWGDLKKAEHCLRVSLVDTQRGGADGGRTRLTTQGRKWLIAYERFRNDVQKTLDKAFQKYIEVLKK